VKRSSKYIKNIHNLFITITFPFIWIEDWMQEAKGPAMWPNQSNSKALSRFLMDKVIDPKGAYYYDPKELLPSSHTTED
jgi:hypothetical protein